MKKLGELMLNCRGLKYLCLERGQKQKALATRHEDLETNAFLFLTKIVYSFFA